MLRMMVRTDLGVVRVYDSGKVLLRPKRGKKWHKLIVQGRIFRGVGYKQRKTKQRHLRAVK